MVFVPPNFNLLCDVWYAGNTPNTGLADELNQACQLYLNTRGLLDITPGDPDMWAPPIYLRLPYALATTATDGQIFEVPVLTGRFYKKRWVDLTHAGFPNQYWSLVLEQCDGDGTAILRDVT